MNQKWIEPATLENAIARLEPPAPGHHDALGRLKNRSDMKTATSGVSRQSPGDRESVRGQSIGDHRGVSLTAFSTHACQTRVRGL